MLGEGGRGRPRGGRFPDVSSKPERTGSPLRDRQAGDTGSPRLRDRHPGETGGRERQEGEAARLPLRDRQAGDTGSPRLRGSLLGLRPSFQTVPFFAVGGFLVTMAVSLSLAYSVAYLGFKGARPSYAHPLPIKKESVAVCLAGGLRTFELTASSIIDHLLNAYPRTHVFVSAPLNEDSHKILLLEGAADIRAVKFISQIPLSCSPRATRILEVRSSPSGVQGLLQYFELVEGCMDLIQSTESKLEYRYNWVFRTRPDGLWSDPPPRLSDLDKRAYAYPAGSLWGGINDRAGITHRTLANATLRRLSVLEELPEVYHGPGLNSEKCLKEHLKHRGITPSPAHFPFCVLSIRKYWWPPCDKCPVTLSLVTEVPMNGAKCRPCRPVLEGEAAWKIVTRLRQQYGAPFPVPDEHERSTRLWEVGQHGVVEREQQGERVGQEGATGAPLVVPKERSKMVGFCDAREAWGPDWEALFDAQVGRNQSDMRTSFKELNQTGCVARLRSFLAPLPRYEGPGAEVLCALKNWAPVITALSATTPSLSTPEPNASEVSYAGLPLPHTTHLLAGFKPVGSLEELTSAWNDSLLRLGCASLVSFQNPATSEIIRAHASAFAGKTKCWMVKCGGLPTNHTCLFLSEHRPCFPSG